MELNQLSTCKMETMTKSMQYITKDMHLSTLQMEESTLHMEHIAEKTKKETSSMHFITLVTLVFLPPTFISVRYGLSLIRQVSMPLTDGNQTFLGSGVFQWEAGVGEGQEAPRMPVWKPDYFTLFTRISFPLVGVIILIWLAATIFRPRIAKTICTVKSWIRCEKIQQDDEEACAGLGIKTTNFGQ